MSKIVTTLRFLPAAMWYGLIWMLSAQPADVSTEVSHGVTGDMMSVGDALSGGDAAYQVATEAVQMTVKELLSFFIRKGAHMFLFFVLAILLWFGFSSLIQKRSLRALCTAFSCAVFAALDEFHQTFVPGRSGELRDVLVDLSGSLIAMLLFALPVVCLWLCRKAPHPERLWLIGTVCGGILLIYVGLLTGLAPIFIPRIGSSPFLCSLPVEERTAVVSSAAPILRQLLYLLSCTITGALSLFLAVLAGNHRTVLAAFAASLCLSLVCGIIWTLPVLAGCALCLVGGGAALFLHKCFPLLSQ